MKIILGICLLTCVQIANSCKGQAEPETYLIPSNFVGRVNILFNKKEGVIKKYENNRRVYEIPSDGILITQFNINDGLSNREYYSLDSSGKKTRLEIFNYEYNKDGSIKWIIKDKNKKGIFMDGISGKYGNTNDSNSAKYQEFVVSSYDQLDHFSTKEYQKEFNDRIEKITGLTLYLK